jgi:type IV pilus assembly protein PilC
MWSSQRASNDAGGDDVTTQLDPPVWVPPAPPGAPVPQYDEPVKKPWYKAEFYVGRAVKPEELMNFSVQAASFLRAGVPILDSLAVVGEENASKKMQEVLAEVQLRLRSGSSFGDAIAQHPKVFPGYYIAVVRAAELTGQLDDALERLAEYLEREVAAKKEIKSALTYPIIVSCIAIVAVVIMSVYVLPKFKDLYTSLGTKLPLPTRMLLGFTTFMSNWWWLVLAILVAALVLIVAVYGGAHGKTRRDRRLLKLPVVGRLFHLMAVERFCSVLATLVHSGVPLPDAVQVSANSTNNAVFQEKLGTVREAMMRGEGLARPIQASGLFPPAARQMIRVGEATGSLDAQLENAAKFYERELKFHLRRATDMFEPAIIIFIGSAVAFIAIAQVSAMYSIYSQVKVK